MNRMVITSFLTLILICGGCDLFQKKDVNQVDPDALYGAKDKLQREINRKYDNPEAHYQLGKIYQSEGLLERADWEFTLALQFNPVMHKAQAAKVRVFGDLGQKDRARLAAELYISQAAASAEASSLLGKGFQQENLDDYALVCYQQALSMAPNSAALNKQIGYYYLSKGDTVRAEEYLRRSVQLDPYQPEVAEQLGRMGVVIQVPRKVENAKTVDKAMNQQ